VGKKIMVENFLVQSSLSGTDWMNVMQGWNGYTCLGRKYVLSLLDKQTYCEH